MVSVIAEDIVTVGVFAAAALLICWQWLAHGKLQRQLRGTLEQMAEVRNLLDQAPLGLAILDRELRYVYINQLLARINGIDAAVHVGRAVDEIVPDLSQDAADRFRDVIRTGQPLLGLILTGTTPAQPGIARAWRESVYPRRDRHGNIIGVTVAVEEITEQQRLQERLHASDMLERRRARRKCVASSTPGI